MKDVLRDDTGDILIRDGNLVFGDGTLQHQRDLLMAHKGHIRHAPLVGVGVIDFMDDENPNDLLREIRKEFVRDGMTVKDLGMLPDGSIQINAPYE